MTRAATASRAWAIVVLMFCTPLALAAQLTLDVVLDPESRRLDVVAALVTEGDFRFELHESLAVRRARSDGRTVAVTSSGSGERRQWRIAAGKGAKLEIEYGGTLPVLDPDIDHRRVLQGLAPMASAAGTFLPGGRGWYPEPRGLFSYAVKLSLPASQRGLVAGTLVAETLPTASNDRYIASFEFEHPAESIDLMAGPYVVREKLMARQGAKPLRLRTYFYPDLEPLADDYLADTARYIELYSKQIGAYPFEAFSIVASPLPTGFGMPTLTYLGAQVLKLPFIRATSLGHEVLHNWWGNGVYVDYAQGNWSEGLTTFMADYHYRERESDAAAREMRRSWLRDFAAVPDGAHRPLAAFRSRTHGAEAAVGYGKAAMVFVMLRDEIGADAFDRGVRAFWQRQRFRTASWEDLRTAFEASSGRGLRLFFEQWVTRAGGAKLTLSDARASGTTLTLTVTQSRPAYAVQLPLEIVAGDRTVTRTVAVDGEKQTVRLALDRVPQRARLDPDVRLWRVLDPRELPPILRQWIVARAPRLAIVTMDADVRAAASSVARAFFEVPPQEADISVLSESREPLLIAGLHADIDSTLARRGLPPRPQLGAARGSAEVWTIRNAAGAAPIAILSARDAAALAAVARALPHYGWQSYLVFEGAKVIARGVWPGEAPVVAVTVER